MTAGPSPWQVLGIDPTTDTRAIRSAYVRALKAIDVEADPQAFIALREAFEAAQAGAGRAAFDANRSEPPQPAAPVIEEAVQHGDRDDGAVSAAIALEHLLYGGGAERQRPSPEQAVAMLKHWSAIVSDPRMQEVGHYADVEQWASELIARTVPFSDPLVVPATVQFGWTARAGTIALPPTAAFLTARSVPLSFAAEVQQPGHPHHSAWLELTRPPDADGKVRRSSISPILIDRLVGTVLRHYPELYGQFDPNRLALWRVKPAVYLDEQWDDQQVSSGLNLLRWALLAWLGFSLLAAVIGVATGK